MDHSETSMDIGKILDNK